MINAKKEIMREIEDKELELVRIVFGKLYGANPQKIIEGDLSNVLPMLDFEYDNGYGIQYLHGYIWYKDGTWSERVEYDGSEWWEHKVRPPIDVSIDA